MRISISRPWRAVAASVAVTALVSVVASGGTAAQPRISGPLVDTLSKGVGVWNVDKLNYAAQEFFVSGTADVDVPVSMADAKDMSQRDSQKDFAKQLSYDSKVLASAQPYITRIVVYRPKRADRFSGNVIVEIVHPGEGGSLPVWGSISGAFIRHGDVYVTVQHPLTFANLKQADPQRYGELTAADPTQIWGMVAQTGAAFHKVTGILPKAFNVRRVYLTGYSYTGVAAATFANYHHAAARQANGKPIFDGYLAFANAMYVRPLDVPVIRVNTQSEFNSFGGLNNRGNDSDDSDAKYRLYEVAGSSHVITAPEIIPAAGKPAPVKMPETQGLPKFSPNKCLAGFPKSSQANNLPLTYVMAQAFDNMYRWVDQGIAPPRTLPIKTDAQGKALMDADGNVQGGLRLAELATPAATYGTGDGDCLLFGYRTPFSVEQMKDRYGSKAAYIDALRKAVIRDVAQRLVPAAEKAAILKRAQALPAF